MNELDKPIGTKEQPKLSAGSVMVSAVNIVERPTKKGGKVKIVEFDCKHPDSMDILKLSNLKIKKVQGNNETITKDGIWYREDVDGNIDKRCNASIVMTFYKKNTLKEFVGTAITTEQDALGYLTIKAY
jgi:hypothetical protein